jgi:hypothetical protein
MPAMRGGIVAVLALLAAAGCGATVKTATVGTSAPAGRGNPAPTRVLFIGEADTICRSDRGRLAAIAVRAKTPQGHPTLHALEQRLTPLLLQALAIERAQLARLRALAEPRGERARIEKVLAAIEQKLAAESSMEAAFAHVSKVGLGRTEAAIRGGVAAEARAPAVARAYGIECGGAQ